MTKIIVDADCGNSPKNIFLKDLIIAFAKGNSKFILENVTDDIVWNIVGNKLLEGKANVAKWLSQRLETKVAELSIDRVATHGKSGFINGKLKFKNGKTSMFCDAYEFSNTKGSAVKVITSYIIETK